MPQEGSAAVSGMGRRAHGRRRRARRGAVTAGVALLVAAGVWYAAIGHSELSNGSPSTTTTRAPATLPAPRSTTTAPAPRTTTSSSAAAPQAIGTFKVTTARLTLVEDPGPSQRSLPTTIWFPVVAGRRPLLVFSQGFWEPVSTYQTLLTDWASAGFVVAAPTYPHTTRPPHPYTRSTPTGTTVVDGKDIVNHPADLRFVIQSVLDYAAQRGNALFGRIDPSAIGLVGHSDGGDVSLAVAADSADLTPRVKAVAVLSGAELANYFGGTYYTPTVPAVPLLAVQSRTDTVNYPSCSVQLYDGAPQPKWYLELAGASHLGGYTTAPWRTVVAQVVTRFFEAELAHEPTAMQGISSVADTSVSTISNGPTAPAQPGTPTCDAAP